MEEYGIMEYLEQAVTRCGRWTGNREFIWSGLTISAPLDEAAGHQMVTSHIKDTKSIFVQAKPWSVRGRSHPAGRALSEDNIMNLYNDGNSIGSKASQESIINW